MDCETIREKLLEYADGDLDLKSREAVEAHLAHCYTCQEELAEIRTVLDACKHVMRHPEPTNRFNELRSHLAEAPAPLPSNLMRLRLRRLGYGLATAAALAMVFWSSAPTVRAAKAFLAPLRVVDSAAFQEWAESKESVAPVVAMNFIDRRMRIEETLDKGGEVPASADEAEPAAEALPEEPAGAPGEEPAPDTEQDARLYGTDLTHELTHA